RAAELLVAAKADGIRERTLDKAKKLLGIESETARGDDGRRYWLWTLPPDPAPCGLEPLDEIEFDPLPDIFENAPRGTTEAGRAILAREQLAWCDKVLKRGRGK